MKYLVSLLAIIVLTVSCDTDEPTRIPRPRMFPKVDYPAKAYKDFDESFCDFTFKMPEYATISKDTSYMKNRGDNECWFDLNLPSLNADINFSYVPVSPATPIDKLVGDAFTLVGKHNTKADYIQETLINNRYGNGGMKFNLAGEVASPIQFYLTDTTHHFVRASLYFNSTVDSDSLAPIVEYIESDIDMILSSFKWIDRE